jgi:hypothetical protein
MWQYAQHLDSKTCITDNVMLITLHLVLLMRLCMGKGAFGINMGIFSADVISCLCFKN